MHGSCRFVRFLQWLRDGGFWLPVRLVPLLILRLMVLGVTRERDLIFDARVLSQRGAMHAAGFAAVRATDPLNSLSFQV